MTAMRELDSRELTDVEGGYIPWMVIAGGAAALGGMYGLFRWGYPAANTWINNYLRQYRPRTTGFGYDYSPRRRAW